MKKLILFLICGLLVLPGLAFASSQITSGATTGHIFENVRWMYLDESSTNPDKWPDYVMLRYLNAGILDISIRTHCLEVSGEINLMAGVTQYELFSTAATTFGVSPYLTVTNVLYRSGVTAWKSLLRGSLDTYGHKYTKAGQPVTYMEYENRLIIEPVPDSSVHGNLLYVYYVGQPAALRFNHRIPLPASYETALGYYMAKEAWKKVRRFDLSQFYEQFYEKEVDRIKSDLVNKPKQPEETLKR
jgi:hypothetical protein